MEGEKGERKGRKKRDAGNRGYIYVCMYEREENMSIKSKRRIRK